MHLKAVELYGTGLTIVDVDVLRACQQDVAGITNVENFVISINADSGITTGNLIKRCTVGEFYNPTGWGKCSAISINQWGSGEGYMNGSIEDCSVSLNGYGGEFAYNATRTISCILSNNYATKAQRGFNNDTPYNLGMTFVRNTIDLRCPSYGMLFMNDSTWCRLYENTIFLEGSGSSGFQLVGPYTDSSGHVYAGVSHMLLDHNTIAVTTNGLTGISRAFNLAPGLMPHPATAIDVENNLIVTNDYLVSFAPTNVGYMVGNYNNTGFPAGVNLGWRYTPCRSDLNLDGNIDLLLQDASFYMKTWCLNSNGNRLSELPLTPSNPGRSWRVVGTGDINRDGRTDLFFQYSNLNLGYWILSDTNQTSGGMFPSANLNPGGSWKVAAVGDFNNDNKPDLLFQDDGGWLAVWFMDGVYRTSSAWLNPNSSGSSKRRAVGTGDFNHDGKVDILFQYDDFGGPDDGDLTVWLMNGIEKLGDPVETTPLNPEDRNLRVVATGDIGTLGTAPLYHDDIIFQHRNSTNVQMWFMDGINRVATNSTALSVGSSYRIVAPK